MDFLLKILSYWWVLAPAVQCDTFQDTVAFLSNGGRKGRQTGYLTAGTYRINTFLFDLTLTDLVRIEDNKVGIITTLDGEPIEAGSIAGRLTDGHNNFQDADAFLRAGGNRGLQQQVVLAGLYNYNPWFVQAEQVDMVSIPIGSVGVVNSYVGPEGKDLSGDEFKHGNIVAKGHKGVWAEPLGPGKYPLNPYIMKTELVPNYAAGEPDENADRPETGRRTKKHLRNPAFSTGNAAGPGKGNRGGRYATRNRKSPARRANC